ncbi:MAG: LLM class F420-dependent oxidoreductase [Acidimicrobiia bacterium]|nr:LLM class F420-dependent oxidoreductase [Acidimicrobiia bacterium]
MAATEVAVRAQELGYRSYWTAEANGPESFAVLAAAGAAAPGLDLGTGIVPIQVRSPLLAAMGAATLQALHPGRRVLLGVGISSPVITGRWHGVPYGEHPLSQMREYVDVLRALLASEAVTHDGPTYQLKGAQLGVRLGEQRPLVVLAALNPGMLRLAGEVADGVLLNYLPSSYVGASVASVREGEAAAGRAPGSCRVFAYVHVGVAERGEEARDRARRDVWSYAVADGYARMFRKAGYAAEIDALRAARDAGDRKGQVAAISDRMCDDIDFVGPAEEVAAFVQAYADAGVDEPVVMPLPWGPDRMKVIQDTIAAVASS